MACACGVCRRCVCRRAQARYKRSEKGKATTARYLRSPKARAAHARYRAGAKGQQTGAAHNARRIFIGSDYKGKAPSTEVAAVIRQHVKERLQCYHATVDKSES
jgi:hypothetical protein